MSERWIRVCKTGDLLPGETAVAWDEDTPILVVNLDGDCYALEDRCTHEEFELSAGPFDPATASIECVLHGSKFDVRDGRALNPPAYAPVRTYRTRIEDGTIWVCIED